MTEIRPSPPAPTPAARAAAPPRIPDGAPPQTPEDLDYELPAASIAQTPLDERDQARLLVDRGDRVEHRRVTDLDTLLEPGDVMVVNDTRVFPARLRLRRATGGAVEVLLLEEAGSLSGSSRSGSPPDDPSSGCGLSVSVSPSDDQSSGDGWSRRPSQDDTGSGSGGSGHPNQDDSSSGGGWWEALVKPSRRLRPGEMVASASGGLRVEIGADLGRGRRLVRPAGLSESDLADFHQGPSAAAADHLLRGEPEPVSPGWSFDRLEEAAEVALPPYIRQPVDDPERYQTVFARRPGSVAAPTAGLHLTEALLEKIRARGVTVAPLELSIGLDTFRPVTAERLDDHVMHRERYRVPATTAEAVAAARRVVAAGTTTVRALETWAATGAAAGRSSLFIRRPFDWRVVDVLMTNFHLPRSTLLCLIDAFIGPRWRVLYQTALAEGYRFLSFGDAMLLSRALYTGTIL